MTAGPGDSCCGDEDNDNNNDSDDDDDDDGATVKGSNSKTEANVFQTFLREKWAPLVLHPISKVVILIVFTGLCGMFGYFATLVHGNSVPLPPRLCLFLHQQE